MSRIELVDKMDDLYQGWRKGHINDEISQRGWQHISMI